jgi:hypothetical protein
MVRDVGHPVRRLPPLVWAEAAETESEQLHVGMVADVPSCAPLVSWRTVVRWAPEPSVAPSTGGGGIGG